VQVGLARAHLATGDAARAREALTRALELDPRNAEARRLLGSPAPPR
jgi:Flp pilus assembly protein TadD